MTSSDENERYRARHNLEKEVVVKQERKIKARQEGERSAWFGLGMFGLVGWSVAVPRSLAWRSACGSTRAGRVDSPGPSC